MKDDSGLDLFEGVEAALLRSLSETLRLGVVAIDGEGRITFANRYGRRFFTPGEDFLSIVGNPGNLGAILKDQPGDAAVPARLQVPSAGRIHSLEAAFIPLDKDEHVTGVVFKDATPALEAKEEVGRQQDFYRNLFDHLGVGLLLLDAECRIKWHNDTAAEWAPFLNMPPGGKPCGFLEKGPPEGCSGCPVRRARDEEKVVRSEEEVNVTGRGRRIFHVVAAPVKDARGRLAHVKVLFEDVTEVRSRQAEHRHLLEEMVTARTRELEEANRRLIMLDEMKDEFLANVTHELRTPLVSGIGYIELVLQGGMGEISEEAADGLNVAHRNLLRLTDLIEDLLTYARLKDDPEEMSFEPLDLARMITDCVSDLRIRQRTGGSRWSCGWTPTCLRFRPTRTRYTA